MPRVRYPEGPAELSDRARKVFHLAHQEAQRLDHPAVGVEHLLLGFAKEGSSPAAVVLHRLGFDLRWLRMRVERARPRGPSDVVRPPSLPYTPGLDSILRAATAASQAAGGIPLSPERILAALLHEGDRLVTRVLGGGFAQWRLRRKMQRIARDFDGLGAAESGV